MVGAGLWNHTVAALVFELGLLGVGAAIYLRSTSAQDRIGRWAPAAFLAFLVVVQIGNTFGEAPPSVTAIAWVGQLQWVLVAWALWMDHHRAPHTPTRISEAAA